VQFSVESTAGAIRLKLVLNDAPFSEAVICTFVSVLTAAAVAVNATLVAPDAIATVAGTVTLPLLLNRLTESPPLGAAAVRLTVHVLVPAPVSDDGLQLIPLNPAAAVTITEAVLFTPAALAVTVALCDVEALPAVAVNIPLVAPEATVMEAGTVSAALLLLRLTAKPALGAAFVNPTVQVLREP
jgi:hypothetical protein